MALLHHMVVAAIVFASSAHAQVWKPIQFNSNSWFLFALENGTNSSTGEAEEISSGLEWAGLERHVWAWIVAGIFAILACLYSFREIYYHLINNHDDQTRKWVIRVFLMVPFYAIEAWLGLYAHHYTEYWDLARECYEAYAIYAFFMFLMHFLGGEEALIEKSREEHIHKHMMPCCCLKPWTNIDGAFTRKNSIGVLQYVPIKLITAILTFILTKTGDYTNGTFARDDAYPYIALIVNCSQLVAMYCLVLFLHANQPALNKIRPIAKLMCIKLVVFFTFWQSIAISGLVHIGQITETQTYSVEEAAAGLQDFIICIEMLLAAIGHHYAFPYMEFHDPAKVHIQRPVLHKLGSVFKQGDIVNHITAVVAPQKKKGDFDLDGPSSDSTVPISPAVGGHNGATNGNGHAPGIPEGEEVGAVELLPPPQRHDVEVHVGTPGRRLSTD